MLSGLESIMINNEKGGTPYNLSKSTDFIACMENGGMSDNGFTGNLCNGQGKGRRINKRLDRIMVNEEGTNHFQVNKVDHKAKTGSEIPKHLDHTE